MGCLFLYELDYETPMPLFTNKEVQETISEEAFNVFNFTVYVVGVYSLY